MISGQICYRLLAKDDIKILDDIIDELNLNPSRLKQFLSYPQNLAFIAEFNNKAIGFLYGYSLMSLDSKPQLFIYSVDVLLKYQNNGIGSGLFQFVVDYSRENDFSECFVIIDKSNKRAYRVYEKSGGKNDYEDEIVYVIKHD